MSRVASASKFRLLPARPPAPRGTPKGSLTPSRLQVALALPAVHHPHRHPWPINAPTSKHRNAMTFRHLFCRSEAFPIGMFVRTNSAIPSGSSCWRRHHVPPGELIDPGATVFTRLDFRRQAHGHRLGVADQRTLAALYRGCRRLSAIEMKNNSHDGTTPAGRPRVQHHRPRQPRGQDAPRMTPRRRRHERREVHAGDQDVDSPEALRRQCDEPLSIRVLRQVRLDRNVSAPAPSISRRVGLQRLGGARGDSATRQPSVASASAVARPILVTRRR